MIETYVPTWRRVAAIYLPREVASSTIADYSSTADLAAWMRLLEAQPVRSTGDAHRVVEVVAYRKLLVREASLADSLNNLRRAIERMGCAGQHFVWTQRHAATSPLRQPCTFLSFEEAP